MVKENGSLSTDGMKDFMGYNLRVGDIVTYSSSSESARMEIGRVVSFTPKRVYVKPIKSGRFNSSPSAKRPHNLCLVHKSPEISDLPEEWLDAMISRNSEMDFSHFDDRESLVVSDESK